MDQQQMVFPIQEVLFDLGLSHAHQMQQVLPILTSFIGAVRLFDNLPFHVEFLSLGSQAIEQEIIERDPLERAAVAVEPLEQVGFTGEEETTTKNTKHTKR